MSTRDSVPSDRATCIIASRVTFFVSRLSLDQVSAEVSSVNLEFDVLLILSVSSWFLLRLQTCIQCNQHRDSSFQKNFITSSAKRKMADILALALHQCFIFISPKTLRISYSLAFQSSRKQYPSLARVVYVDIDVPFYL